MKDLIILAIIATLIILAAYKHDKSKKKIQKHIDNGDIIPSEMTEYTPHSTKETRKLFRNLANK